MLEDWRVKSLSFFSTLITFFLPVTSGDCYRTDDLTPSEPELVVLFTGPSVLSQGFRSPSFLWVRIATTESKGDFVPCHNKTPFMYWKSRSVYTQTHYKSTTHLNPFSELERLEGEGVVRYFYYYRRETITISLIFRYYVPFGFSLESKVGGKERKNVRKKDIGNYIFYHLHPFGILMN